MTFTRRELEEMVGGPIAIGPNGVARKIVAPEPSTAGQPKDRYKSKWERQYGQRLGTLMHAQAISWWEYESIRLRLADGAWYTPDFAVLNGRLEMHEIKGHWREAARVRVKVAAQQFPWLPILIIRPINGQFRTIEAFNA